MRKAAAKRPNPAHASAFHARTAGNEVNKVPSEVAHATSTAPVVAVIVELKFVRRAYPAPIGRGGCRVIHDRTAA